MWKLCDLPAVDVASTQRSVALNLPFFALSNQRGTKHHPELTTNSKKTPLGWTRTAKYDQTTAAPWRLIVLSPRSLFTHRQRENDTKEPSQHLRVGAVLMFVLCRRSLELKREYGKKTRSNDIHKWQRSNLLITLYIVSQG